MRIWKTIRSYTFEGKSDFIPLLHFTTEQRYKHNTKLSATESNIITGYFQPR